MSLGNTGTAASRYARLRVPGPVILCTRRAKWDSKALLAVAASQRHYRIDVAKDTQVDFNIL